MCKLAVCALRGQQQHALREAGCAAADRAGEAAAEALDAAMRMRRLAADEVDDAFVEPRSARTSAAFCAGHCAVCV